jgi:hypothetical protein
VREGQIQGQDLFLALFLGYSIDMATELEPIGNEGYLTDVTIRSFLRDNDPTKNLLLDDLEFTVEEIRNSRNLIIDMWNETPPPTEAYRYDTFPYRYHLLIGISSLLLRSAAMRYRRNDLQYNIGGGAIQDQAKAKEYDKTADDMMTEFKTFMTREKRRQNMERGFGFD